MIPMQQNVESHLNIQLQHSQIKVEKENPVVSVINKMTVQKALHAHAMLSLQNEDLKGNLLTVSMKNIWKLCESLWGSLTTLSGTYIIFICMSFSY